MTVSDEQTNVEEMREKVRQHFLDKPTTNQANQWESCWQQGLTPWDRSKPNPALYDTLDQKTSILGSPLTADGQRRKALVPGCGGGYDVWLLSGYGYDACGLDSSPSAIEKAQTVKDSPEFGSLYPTRDTNLGRGTTKFVLGDFFKDDFLEELRIGSFDLIYDFTFLCALPPSLRPLWSRRMAELLSPCGHLVCMMYPLHKPPKAGGPPHGLSSALYQQLLRNPGMEVLYDEEGRAVTDDERSSENALKKVDEWPSERSYDGGQGQFRVSIWQKS